MFKTITTATLLLALTMGITSNASAADYSPAIDARQANQADRIAQGMRSGELTGWESARLINQQVQVRAMERRFEADGHLGRMERARLNNKLNHNSNVIFKQKHDRGHR